MAFSVVMPALEMAQETGKLIAWRKKEGDSVRKGEPLLEIETDKAVMEIESPADGILAGVTGQVGTDIKVGKTIAWIVAPGEKPPSEDAASSNAPAARASSQPRAEAHAAVAAESVASPQARISPKARRLAKDLGVDISALRGSGPGGEILASDVQAGDVQAAAALATSAPGTSPTPGNLEVPTTLGRLMAERTTHSWTTVPHFFVTRAIEATALNEYRQKLVAEIERTHNVRITHTDLLVALVARVLIKHPRINSSWTADGIRIHDHVNMGIAIAVNDGVVAAVIPNAHTATLPEIAQQRVGIASRARAGKLNSSDIVDGTFTISNLGMYQVDQFTAIIVPPQSAILAVGTIADRVLAVDGKPVVRPTMTMTLSCDHRAADGAKAAAFLGDISDAITNVAQHLG